MLKRGLLVRNRVGKRLNWHRSCLSLVMIVAAGFLVAGVGSLALIIRELRKAPEGYEDEHGFYTVGKREVEYGAPDSTAPAIANAT